MFSWQIKRLTCAEDYRSAERAGGGAQSELRPSERIPLGSRPLGSRRQTACKPGSVPRKPGGWPFIWDSRRRLPRATHPDGGAETRLDAPGVNRALSAPSLFGLAPGEACHAAPVASRAVRSYRTLSPLPGPMPGGLLSVALSRGSPPPGVTRHRISVEPGLSSPGRVSPLAGRGHPAVWPCLHRYPTGCGQDVRPTPRRRRPRPAQRFADRRRP